MSDDEQKLVKKFKVLGTIKKKNFEEIVNTMDSFTEKRSMEDIDLLNAYSIQSGCSACSGSTMTNCC